MGRKKKGPIKSPHELELEAIEELREDFLALCHVDPPEDESRTELSEALLALRQAQEDDFTTTEECACRLRVARIAFMEYLVLERQEICEIYQDLQGKSASLSIQDLITYEGVYRSYLKQIAQEEQLMDDVLDYLNKLYTSAKDNRQIGVWIRQFSKRQLMTNSSRLSTLKLAGTPSEATDTLMHTPSSDLLMSDTSPANPNSLILEADTVVNAAKTFIHASSPTSSLTSLLVVGPPGSGKTHFCTQIEQEAKHHCHNVQVFRPKLPVDFMGASVGDAEYFMETLFNAVSSSEKSVLILDDLDILLGEEDAPTSLAGIRLRLSFLSHLDQLHGCNALLLCTASTPLDDELARFHKTFILQAPDRDERVEMVQVCLGIFELSEGNEEALGTLSTCMLGRSRAEIAQYCRQAIKNQLLSGVAMDSLAGKEMVLESMTAELGELAPESLRSGVFDGFVDMTIVSSAELLQGTANESSSLPLHGGGMDDAWRQLEALVVTPLCQAQALDRILSGGHQDSQRTFCGGVLLTGAAGTGKTALAYHAARVASKYLPSAKLLDVSCTSLVHKEVGGSERAMRRLFTAVRAAAPCILLLDGIENIAGVRGKDNTTHGTMDRILSTLLTELDGLDDSPSTGNNEASAKFAVIGITHDVSWIDTALRRPGRLEKTIELAKPDGEARHLIALRHLRDFVVSGDYDADTLASLLAETTEGETAAEIVALCEEARMASLKEAIQKAQYDPTSSPIEPALRLEHFRSLLAMQEIGDDVSV